MREVRGASETRAITLQLRAVLCHAASWVVDDRNGHNQKIGSSPPRAAAAVWSLGCLCPSGTSNTGITQDRVIPRVLPGNTLP